MLVDDAHWLDGSSAQALLFAFRRLVADPIAVLLAVREGEPSLLDGADLPTLRIGGLTSGDAAAPARACRRRSPAPAPRDGRQPARAARAGRGPSDPALALAPEDAPVLVSARIARAFVQRLHALDDPHAGRSCSRRPATAAICRCSSAPPRASDSTSPRSPRRSARAWSRCAAGWSSSATRSPARRSTPTRRPSSGATPTGRWPRACPTATSTAAPGTSPQPRSAPTTAASARSSRRAPAAASAARTPSPPPRSSAPGGSR